MLLCGLVACAGLGDDHDEAWGAGSAAPAGEAAGEDASAPVGHKGGGAGRVLDDEGAWPGTGEASPGAVPAGLERVAVHRVCASPDPAGAPCAYTVLASGGTAVDELVFLPGPEDGFALLRRRTRGASTLNPQLDERSVTRLDAGALPRTEPAPLDLLALDLPGQVGNVAASSRDGRWLVLRSPPVGTRSANPPEGAPLVDDPVVRVDLRSLEAEVLWLSGTRWLGALLPPADDAAVWVLARENAYLRVGTGAAATSRNTPAGPDVPVRVDAATGTAIPWSFLQGRLQGGGIELAIDATETVAALTLSGASPRPAGSGTRWTELWNLRDRTRVFTLRSEDRDRSMGQPWFTGQPDRLLVELGRAPDGTFRPIGAAEVWDLARRVRLAHLELPGVWALSPDGRVLGHIRPDPATLELVEVETGAVLASHPLAVELEGTDTTGALASSALAFSGDGSRVLVDVRWPGTAAPRTLQVFEVMP